MLPRIDWNALLGVSCNRLLDGKPRQEPCDKRKDAHEQEAGRKREDDCENRWCRSWRKEPAVQERAESYGEKKSSRELNMPTLCEPDVYPDES